MQLNFPEVDAAPLARKAKGDDMTRLAALLRVLQIWIGRRSSCAIGALGASSDGIRQGRAHPDLVSATSPPD